MTRLHEHCSRVFSVWLGLAVLAGSASFAEELRSAPASPNVAGRPAGAGRGPVVVPDRFLRRWDPVTVFFDTETGPAAGGPEDQPDRHLTMTPEHPGAFEWLDSRTLQFRPADPWPALSTFRFRIKGREVALRTLMDTPLETYPEADASGLEPFDEITLVFPEPLLPAALLEMTRVELRPLPVPGVGQERVKRLVGGDLEVKPLGRSMPSEPVSYVLRLSEPIPYGTHVAVVLRLASGDDDEMTFWRREFQTAQPFRVVDMGCLGTRYPVSLHGSRYGAEELLECEGPSSVVVMTFSETPGEIDPLLGGSLVRFSPAVDDLVYQVQGRRLEVRGRFVPETAYEVSLQKAPVADRHGRLLEMLGPSSFFVAFPSQEPFLRWESGEGVVERRGPKQVPLLGRGEARMDLRIVPVDPRDLSFWPFPEQPVAVDESVRPPGPGEEPDPVDFVNRPVDSDEISRGIAALDAAPLSRFVDLPLRKSGAEARFGLELTPHLSYLSGEDAAGHFLVGLRRLDGSSSRSWARLQVTDLSLTTLEEARSIVFAVTSLSSGKPVPGAHVAVEGVVRSRGGEAGWEILLSGETDAGGRLTLDAPGDSRNQSVHVRRITVQKGDDVLVLDPARAPKVYRTGQWHDDGETWLQWAFQDLGHRGAESELLCHLFAERPVYRPDQRVHLKGFVRRREAGRLAVPRLSGDLVVDGPGDLQWRYPVEVSPAGSFYQLFHEEDRPAGIYTAWLETGSGRRIGRTTFRLEAYRLPRFEVDLHGPDQVALDREFEVGLSAEYYAGGRVSGRPVRWRVTQYPLDWTPGSREGFPTLRTGDSSRTERFDATPALEREDKTDQEGSARIVLNPALEPTAQPRSYVVEATVTGADDQTVTATRRVSALPPFVLGLKTPRYLERADSIPSEIIAVGPDGELEADLEVKVRLFHRQWHSYLRASDFSDGVARYVTDVVDEKTAEKTVVTGLEPVKVALPAENAGVYVVEVEAHDRVGRAQVVRVDLFVGGDEPVAWSRPVERVFRVEPDRSRYSPGHTAHLVLKSPFQNAQALVVVEAPEGNSYAWLPVRGGKAVFDLHVEPHFAPRVPVHVLLMRGRIENTGPIPGSILDAGKPATMAATTWLEVEPVSNRLDVRLEHPEKALPGRTIPITVRLARPDGSAVPGEVTLWLVDQAVLALGREQRLDPLPDFVTPVASHLSIRDTRELPFGVLPFTELPGGGEGVEARSPLDRQTVRRNFEPVPYYEPALEVGPDGEVTVEVELPDNLTNFRVRAKAVSGPERFGYASGTLAVRLPVIVQPALPRFARPGDRFTAVGIARLVEGEEGKGRGEIRVEGARLQGEAALDVAFRKGQPARLEFPVEVLEDRPADLSLRFILGVERSSDGAGDAFEVEVPLQPDREVVRDRFFADLLPGTSFSVPVPEEEPREGSLETRLLLSGHPEVIRLATALDFFAAYPYGCTEQRVSSARVHLALARLEAILGRPGGVEVSKRAVNETLEWISRAVDDHGLVGYWPGASGYVSLTAWVAEFVQEAKEAGYVVDQDLESRLLDTLEQALRSDYGRFVDGESYLERAWALAALSRGGRFSSAYGSELARRAQFLGLEGKAEVILAFARAGESSSPVVSSLQEQVLAGAVFRLHQGREVFAGLQRSRGPANGLVHSSETRTLAAMVRALDAVGLDEPRTELLLKGLVALGENDGWGSTSATGAAVLALAEVLEPPLMGGGSGTVQVTRGARSDELAVGAGDGAVRLDWNDPGLIEAVLVDGSGPVLLKLERRYVPSRAGAQVEPRARGFVVSRQLLVGAGGEGGPPTRVDLDQPGTSVEIEVGTVVEEHVQIVNPEDRHFVAVDIPLAAGMEPLNPSLATAPPEATPSGRPTLQPTYVDARDDGIGFYFDTLPKGTYDLYYRTRATIPGTFTQPPARVRAMYDLAVEGRSAGARVEITKSELRIEN